MVVEKMGVGMDGKLELVVAEKATVVTSALVVATGKQVEVVVVVNYIHMVVPYGELVEVVNHTLLVVSVVEVSRHMVVVVVVEVSSGELVAVEKTHTVEVVKGKVVVVNYSSTDLVVVVVGSKNVLVVVVVDLKNVLVVVVVNYNMKFAVVEERRVEEVVEEDCRVEEVVVISQARVGWG